MGKSRNIFKIHPLEYLNNKKVIEKIKSLKNNEPTVVKNLENMDASLSKSVLDLTLNSPHKPLVPQKSIVDSFLEMENGWNSQIAIYEPGENQVGKVGKDENAEKIEIVDANNIPTKPIQKAETKNLGMVDTKNLERAETKKLIQRTETKNPIQKQNDIFDVEDLILND